MVIVIIIFEVLPATQILDPYYWKICLDWSVPFMRSIVIFCEAYNYHCTLLSAHRIDTAFFFSLDEEIFLNMAVFCCWLQRQNCKIFPLKICVWKWIDIVYDGHNVLVVLNSVHNAYLIHRGCTFWCRELFHMIWGFFCIEINVYVEHTTIWVFILQDLFSGNLLNTWKGGLIRYFPALLSQLTPRQQFIIL